MQQLTYINTILMDDIIRMIKEGSAEEQELVKKMIDNDLKILNNG